MLFFATSARCCSAAASLALRSASSASTWAWDTALTANWALSRLSTVPARLAVASSARSWAMSASAFNCTSRSPAATCWPGLKPMLRMMPPTSVVTSTPRTVFIEPTAERLGCQSSYCALSAVTTAGGSGTLAWAISLEICANLTPPITATISSTTPSMISMGHSRRRLRGVCGAAAGCAVEGLELTSAMADLT